MEKWVVEKDVGNLDQRENVKNGEQENTICEEWYDAGWGNVAIC